MDLPNEILPIVVGYLPPSGAIQLNNACQKFHDGLSLTATYPRRILTDFFRHEIDDDAHYGFPIPVHPQVACHSLLLSMMRTDQGWGNHRGRVFIVAEARNGVRATDARRKFDGGRVVCTAGIAQREGRRLAIAFQPKGHESYHLWYAVGGGGARDLRLTDIQVSTLVFDDAARCFRQASDLLARTDPFHAWDQESRTTDALYAWEQESRTNNVDMDIKSFFRTHGEHLLPIEELLALISREGGPNITGTHVQLKLRGYLKSLQESWIEECSVYAQIIGKHSSQRRIGPAVQLDNAQNDDFVEDRMDFGEYVVPED